MAKILHPRRALSTNPLKFSAPLGAALAYLGVEGAIPLLHGSQGCTAFAMVAGVRHFREPIPLQTTALHEVSAILGGADHIEEAIANLRSRAAPKLVGIASTALTETRGEDVPGEIRAIRARRPDFADTAIVYASTPDFAGAMEDGWARAVEAMVEALVEPADPSWRPILRRRINVLAGCHLTAGDIGELRDLIGAFGFEAVVLPDLSASLDGHLAENWSGASTGGTRLDDIRAMGSSRFTLAFGESMRGAAERLEARTAVPFAVIGSATGLDAVDALVGQLMALAGVADTPAAVKRDRSRLLDAMLDAHFFIGGLKVAIGADPDLLAALSGALAGMGAEVVTAVTTSAANPALAAVPAETVIVGDLGDLEQAARAAGAGVLLTHTHGQHAAAALHLPHVRVGFPVFDRLGAQDACRVGYRGTRAFLFEVANAVLSQPHRPRPEDFGALPIDPEFEHARPQTAPH